MNWYRSPGILGHSGGVEDLNDGTLIRGISPKPGPFGIDPISKRGRHEVPALATKATATMRHRGSARSLPELRQTSRGPDVQKMQRLLNACLAPSPNLAVDGIFGQITLQSVLQFQKGVSIAADGVVGKQTWYHLLKGDKAAILQPLIGRPQSTTTGSSATTKSPSPGPQVSSTPNADVWECSLEEKFAEALRRTAPKLPGSMRHEFEALLSPTSLGIMAGTLVVWAGSHAFGVGEVVDVGLLIGGALFLGIAVIDVASELGDFLVVTSSAAAEEDLDEAASHLARAISIMGIAAFIALLARFGRGRGGSKGTAAETAPKPVRKQSPSQRNPNRPAAPTPELVPQKPTGKGTSALELQLDEMYLKSPAAKAEIDTMAEAIAKATGGRVAKAPLKGRARALEKAIEYEKRGGDASNVKDIARNTIVVEQSQYHKAVSLLKEQGAKVKTIDPKTDPMGYSGTNAVVKTKAGVPAEIQVNTPEMIYAKERPEIARAILGDEKYVELATKSGVPGGRGHELYEEYRKLPEGDQRAASLATESRAYYDRVRNIGGQ
jgi:hypothetical protein